MEYYFSGTIERIIFENPSSFFRILLLDISDTDAEDFDDFDGHHGRYHGRWRLHLLGGAGPSS